MHTYKKKLVVWAGASPAGAEGALATEGRPLRRVSEGTLVPLNKEYVDEPLHEFHLKKDAGVEDEIQTLRFQRVFVGLLIREHMRFVDGGRKLVVPADAIVAKESWICQDKNYIDAFLNDYEITNEETDFVQSTDIELWINEQDLGITMMKFGIEITKYATIHKYNNVYSKVKRLFGKTTRCWIGIKKNKDDLDFNDNSTDIIY